jgi:hypothetical protein
MTLEQAFIGSKTLLLGFSVVAVLGCQPQNQTSTPSSPAPAATPSPSPPEQQMVGAQQADVQLDKETYFPGQQISVVALATGLQDSAWVGVLPAALPHGSEEENDSHDLDYKTVMGETQLILVAPTEPGDYDVRLHDSDQEGKEVASRRFKVVPDPSPVTEAKILWQPKASVVAGTTLEIPFEAPLAFPEDAWIGIVPAATPHGKESDSDSANLGYAHLDRRSRGTVRLTAPAQPGQYEVRMFDADSDGKEIVSVAFVVVTL